MGVSYLFFSGIEPSGSILAAAQRSAFITTARFARITSFPRFRRTPTAFPSLTNTLQTMWGVQCAGLVETHNLLFLLCRECRLRFNWNKNTDSVRAASHPFAHSTSKPVNQSTVQQAWHADYGVARLFNVCSQTQFSSMLLESSNQGFHDSAGSTERIICTTGLQLPATPRKQHQV